MEDNKQLQEFDLDDILNEFHTEPEEGPEEEPVSAAAEAEPAPEAPEAVSMDTGRMNAILAELTGEKPESPETAPEDDAVSDLLAAYGEEAAGQSSMIELDTGLVDSLLAEFAAEETEEPAVAEDATVRMDSLAEQLEHRQPEDPAVMEDDTIRMDAEPESPAEPVREEPPAILYNPRTRLRELKKKLVAGPEKRYYELSEMGMGKLQLGILLNVIVVVLCGIVTLLFSLGVIPENRLRFVIFTQVLAMLFSAFLGSYQMIDGLAELFRGRFTVNTLLSITFAACCVDAVFCLTELRIPCCAAFSLEITMALLQRYHRRNTEMAQMDTLRKAVRLNGLVRVPDHLDGKAGLLRTEAELEDFMDTYDRPTGPEKLQGIYAFLSLLVCIVIAALAGLWHGTEMAVQILSTSLLVAVPASYFVALTRPMAVLEKRLHMVGTVLCGWQGVKKLCGKAAFPLKDEDIFPTGSTKLNGVKFYGDRDSDEVVSYTTSLICAAGGGLVPVFRQMLSGRDGKTYPVVNFRNYENGGIGGEVCHEPVLLGSLNFLQDMGVEIPEGTMVNQAVYAAIDGQLCAVFAISYAKMRSAAAGLISLSGCRKLTPVLTGGDFMITSGLLRAKFKVNTRRIAFPDRETRKMLAEIRPDPQETAAALITREELVSYAYAVTGARALRTACVLGTVIHMVGGILGMLIMAALAYLGTTELLTPTHVLLYQLVWLIPGLLVSEWTRTV